MRKRGSDTKLKQLMLLTLGISSLSIASILLFKIVMNRGESKNNERRYLRVKLHSDVVVRCGKESEAGIAINISLGGMHIRLQNAKNIGAEIEVDFSLPQNHLFTAKAAVVRTYNNPIESPPFGIGICFLNLAPDIKAEIDQYARKTIRIFKALFFELNCANINESKINELILNSPLDYNYSHDILREIVALELSKLRLRA